MSFRQFVGLRISTEAGAAPVAADISEGELAFNVADGRIFTLFGETVVELTDRYTQDEIDSLMSGKADVSSLAGVATSGAYSDLSGKPLLGTAAAEDATAFDPAGTASGTVSAHEAEPDPHDQYVQKEVGKGLSTEDYTAADRDKLAGIEAGATADQTKADIDSLGVDADTVDGKHANDFDPAGSAQSAQDHAVQRSNHTGTQPADTITETASLKLMTSAERNKLAAVGTLANRDVYISDQPPDNQVGQDGDIWLQHWS